MNINPLKAPENEASIMNHWKYTDKIYISCICITYNQENYIKDTINGMLAQVTDYRFEIIIHDDVSTDNTRLILLEYKEKYPNIIKLILQTENQYQKGEKIIPLAVSSSNGEYIAICEGDDYWLKKHKIDTQIKILEVNKNINLCVHNSYSLNCENNSLTNLFKFQTKKNQIVDSLLIYTTPGQFSATASLFFRKEIFLQYLPIYNKFPVLDFFLETILGDNGVFYIKEKMSLYRYSSIGSWTNNELKNIKNSIDRNEKMLYALDLLNKSMNNTLTKEIEYRKSEVYKDLARLNLNLKNYKNAYGCIKRIKKMKVKNYIKILLSYINSVLR